MHSGAKKESVEKKSFAKSEPTKFGGKASNKAKKSHRWDKMLKHPTNCSKKYLVCSKLDYFVPPMYVYITLINHCATPRKHDDHRVPLIVVQRHRDHTIFYN